MDANLQGSLQGSPALLTVVTPWCVASGSASPMSVVDRGGMCRWSRPSGGEACQCKRKGGGAAKNGHNLTHRTRKLQENKKHDLLRAVDPDIRQPAKIVE